MSRTMFLLLGVIVLGVLGYAAAQTREPEQPIPATTTKPFSSEAVFVRSPDSQAAVLLRPEVRQLGGRFFIVGAQVDNHRQSITKALLPGATTWIPIDTVTEMAEMDLPKQAQ